MKKYITFLLSLLILIGNSFIGKAFAFDDENPLFVTITAQSCYSCQKLKPVVKNLEENYQGRITFITLDVSSKNSIQESKETASQYGLDEFFDKNKNTLPKVGIICPGGKKVENEFLGEINQEVYEKALDGLLADSAQLCSL